MPPLLSGAKVSSGRERALDYTPLTRSQREAPHKQQQGTEEMHEIPPATLEKGPAAAFQPLASRRETLMQTAAAPEIEHPPVPPLGLMTIGKP